MITVKSSGSTDKIEKFLSTMKSGDVFAALESYGRRGVDALASATPVETGLSSSSWDYKVEHKRGSWTLTWFNTNVAGDTPVVILIQYGHGTGTGGYVQGRDFINPAIQPLFDTIADEVWEKVKRA